MCVVCCEHRAANRQERLMYAIQFDPPHKFPVTTNLVSGLRGGGEIGIPSEINPPLRAMHFILGGASIYRDCVGGLV